MSTIKGRIFFNIILRKILSNTFPFVKEGRDKNLSDAINYYIFLNQKDFGSNHLEASVEFGQEG